MKKQEKLLFVLAVMAAFITKGLFLPVLAGAGSLNPGAPPGPTMKTLDEIPPTWSQVLDSTNGEADGCNSSRFDCVLGGEAVLDKETGLVWERSPDYSTRNWANAITYCYRREVANRKGWRLPTIEELTSLVDNDNSNPTLPTDHPFQGASLGSCWSATTSAYGPTNAWSVYLVNGLLYNSDKINEYYVWCVRGGVGHDAY